MQESLSLTHEPASVTTTRRMQVWWLRSKLSSRRVFNLNTIRTIWQRKLLHTGFTEVIVKPMCSNFRWPGLVAAIQARAAATAPNLKPQQNGRSKLTFEKRVVAPCGKGRTPLRHLMTFRRMQVWWWRCKLAQRQRHPTSTLIRCFFLLRYYSRPRVE